MKRAPRKKYKTLKYCNDCGKTRNILFFNQRTGYQAGILSSFCRTCINKRSVEWRHKNKDRYNLYQLNYRKAHEQKKTTKENGDRIRRRT